MCVQNHFTNNSCAARVLTSRKLGGSALYAFSVARLSILETTFESNHADPKSSSTGGAVLLQATTAYIANSTFVNNWAAVVRAVLRWFAPLFAQTANPHVSPCSERVGPSMQTPDPSSICECNKSNGKLFCAHSQRAFDWSIQNTHFFSTVTHQCQLALPQALLETAPSLVVL